MIEEKEQYTFEELCEGLEISMSKFAKLANVDEGTILRLRRGHIARRGTINSLLRAFSEVYGKKFTLDNVTGLRKVEKPITPIATHVPTLPKSTLTDVAISQPLPAQKPTVEPKRTYSPRKSDLPDGTILASKFAESHGVNRTTFYAHMTEGLGPGLIGMSTDTVPERDRVRSEERNKRVRKDGTIEKERYLTQEQQKAALEFWKRNNVSFTSTECDQADCYCHTLKQENQ